jgi:hypothetical protein
MYRISEMPGLTDEQRRELIELAEGEDWESDLDTFDNLRAFLEQDLAEAASRVVVDQPPAYLEREPDPYRTFRPARR